MDDPVFLDLIKTMEKEIMARRVPMTKYEKQVFLAGVTIGHAWLSKALHLKDEGRQAAFLKACAFYIDNDLPEFHKLFCEGCKAHGG